MVSNRTGTVGFASCRSVRSVPASDFSSSEVRARMDSDLPQPCSDATKTTGGGGRLGSCHRVSPTTPTISIQGDVLFHRI